ncbi:MAG: hypothetical protein EBU90_13390 [Proteobacteria bacterium]|nr:hypothetical protein [Pseudomonadota bacterium]NBP15107.1 hypothetical protein [bacterium]
MYKNIIAIALILYAIFGSGLVDLLKNIKPIPQPQPASILNIDKPSNDVILRVERFSNLITDPTDRAKIAIFNYDFANRIKTWNTNNQQVNDVYTLAGKIFFQDSLVNKYSGLSTEITDLLKELLTDDNHILSEEEKNKVNQYFAGIAWVLIQRK